MQKPRITKSEPDEHGHWGKFGGRYVPETLVAPLDELTNEFMRAREDREFLGRTQPIAARLLWPANTVVSRATD